MMLLPGAKRVRMSFQGDEPCDSGAGSCLGNKTDWQGYLSTSEWRTSQGSNGLQTEEEIWNQQGALFRERNEDGPNFVTRSGASGGTFGMKIAEEESPQAGVRGQWVLT